MSSEEVGPTDTKPTKGYAQPGSDGAGAQPWTTQRNDNLQLAVLCHPTRSVIAPPSPLAHVRAPRPPLTRPHSEARTLRPARRAGMAGANAAHLPRWANRFLVLPILTSDLSFFKPSLCLSTEQAGQIPPECYGYHQTHTLLYARP